MSTYGGYRFLGLVYSLALLLAAPALAELRAGEVPIEDVLELIELDRELLAIDAESGGETRVALERGEEVIWKRSRGKVGVVATDRRLLVVGTRSSFWLEARYRFGEQIPTGAELGDRVALMVTSKRVLGFNNRDTLLAEYRIGPHERVLASHAAANAAVVVTNRNALGLSARFAGFSTRDMQLRERVVDVSPRANLATVRTNRRLLIYRAPVGSWAERRLDLRDTR